MGADIIFPNLGIKIQGLNRVAFSMFGVDIHWYGIIITMGMLLGIMLVENYAKKTGQDVDKYYDFAIIAIVASIIGARLYYVIFSWDNYKDNLAKIFSIREGGIAIYGAVIAAIITAIIFTKKNKMNFGMLADTCAPSLILGQAIGRWGNFFNKEAFGGFTDGTFAMAIKKNVISYIPKSLKGTEVLYDGIEYIQVHPTFLYESVWNLTVFIILLMYRKYFKKYNGEVFVLYIIGYSLGRLWIEGLRTDQLLIWNTNIAVSQVLSLILLLVAVSFQIYKRIYKK